MRLEVDKELNLRPSPNKYRSCQLHLANLKYKFKFFWQLRVWKEAYLILQWSLKLLLQKLFVTINTHLS